MKGGKEDGSMSDDCDNSFSKYISWNRPRTRSTTTIWSLPEELLLHLLHGLHVKDLLNLRSTHPVFHDLIDNNPSVWTRTSFQDAWPSQKNLVHFNKAANESNIEALVKLGIAYLYNEGLPSDFEGRGIYANGENAAAMFCRVESLTANLDPFTWLFFRPPWSVNGACCKRCVFTNMKEYVKNHSDSSVEVCIAKTLQLLSKDSENDLSEEMVRHLDTAANLGSFQAAFIKWQSKFSGTVLDKRMELESLRELRDVAQSGSLEAQLQLCRSYGQGCYGEYSERQAASYTQQFIQSSRATNVHRVFCNRELTNSMRYILMDWLVEVADMKDFSSLTLHMAISVVDRYLNRRPVSRSRLQLVGVAAMVLCSRFLDEEILTIREAAWLTDHTYKYEDVVRTMGEITAALNGQFRVLTCLDYVRVIGEIGDNDLTTQCLAEYLCETVLLYSDLSHYKQAVIAASAVLLARLIQEKDYPWSNRLQLMTGFSVDDLKSSVLAIHDKCFMKNAMVDHRNMQLRAVKLRFSSVDFCQVSNIKAMDTDALHRTLGLSCTTALLSHFDGSKVIVKQDPAQISSAAAKDLITSPSRSCAKVKQHRSPVVIDSDLSRQHAATPTVPNQDPPTMMSSPLVSQSDCESPTSSIQSDQESAMYQPFQDEDLESLWCTEQKLLHAACERNNKTCTEASPRQPATSSLSSGKYSLTTRVPHSNTRSVHISLPVSSKVPNPPTARLHNTASTKPATVTLSSIQAVNNAVVSSSSSTSHFNQSSSFTVHEDNEPKGAVSSSSVTGNDIDNAGSSQSPSRHRVIKLASPISGKRKALQNLNLSSTAAHQESRTRNSKRKNVAEHSGKVSKVHIVADH